MMTGPPEQVQSHHHRRGSRRCHRGMNNGTQTIYASKELLHLVIDVTYVAGGELEATLINMEPSYALRNGDEFLHILICCLSLEQMAACGK